MKITKEVAARYPLLKNTVDIFNDQGDGVVFWEDAVSPVLSIVEAEPDKLTWEFQVQAKHCNRYGSIHGGCVATLIDVCSSFAVCCTSGKQWKLIGVSTDLSVQYLRAVPKGETIRLECHVQRVGSSLANIFTRIYDQKNRLCYSGSHSKFNIDSRL